MISDIWGVAVQRKSLPPPGRSPPCVRALPQPHARLLSIKKFDAETLKSALHISHSDGTAGDRVRAAAFHVSDGVHRHFRGFSDSQLVHAREGASRFELVASNQHLGIITNFLVAHNI
jgi:hypothetical protein